MAQDTTTADQIEDPFQIVEEDTATFTALDTTLIPIPELRDDKDTLAILPLGKPFFNYDSDIKNLQNQIDSLRAMVKVFEKYQGIPTVDEDIINLIKVPNLQHRIELTLSLIHISEPTRPY